MPAPPADASKPLAGGPPGLAISPRTFFAHGDLVRSCLISSEDQSAGGFFVQKSDAAKTRESAKRNRPVPAAARSRLRRVVVAWMRSGTVLFIKVFRIGHDISKQQPIAKRGAADGSLGD
jgi:hypothetical protein